MQIANNLISKRLYFVTEMTEEGLLAPNDANLFYKEINDGNIDMMNSMLNYTEYKNVKFQFIRH